MTTLSNNNRTVDFEFGGQLDAWQVQSILHNAESASYEDIFEYLSGKEGWNERNIKEFVEFVNSEEFDQMKF